jgi:DNA transposition AAA+ family ATPase
MLSIDSQSVDVLGMVSRWRQLRDRLIDEISGGMTINRISIEIDNEFMPGQLEAWAKDEHWGRDTARVFTDASLAERIEKTLAIYFDDLDSERLQQKRRSPVRVETSVMAAVFEGFGMARTAPAMVDISVPAGAGKTEAMDEYVKQCKKEEGIDCPVWTIGLSEFGLTVKSVLTMIASEVDPKHHRHSSALNDFELDFLIEKETRGRGGLLIIDEAQHLADAKLDHGIRIVNGLRRYVDKGLFGIALLNNGEVYRRVNSEKYSQLLSRMKEWRVEVKGITEQDVDLVAAAWGITGKDARAWCVNKAKGPGQLRALVSAFKRAQMEYGEITLAALLRKG